MFLPKISHWYLLEFRASVTEGSVANDLHHLYSYQNQWENDLSHFSEHFCTDFQSSIRWVTGNLTKLVKGSGFSFCCLSVWLDSTPGTIYSNNFLPASLRKSFCRLSFCLEIELLSVLLRSWKYFTGNIHGLQKQCKSKKLYKISLDQDKSTVCTCIGAHVQEIRVGIFAALQKVFFLCPVSPV